MLAGPADSLTTISFAVPYYNIATPLVGRKAYLQHKNYLDTQSKIFCQLTTVLSYLNCSVPSPQLSNNDKIPYSHLLPFTTLMPTHYLTLTSDHMLSFRIHKLRLWIFTVSLLKLAHNAAIDHVPTFPTKIKHMKNFQHTDKLT